MSSRSTPMATALCLHFLHHISYSLASATYDDDYYYGSGEPDYNPSPNPFHNACYRDTDCRNVFIPHCCTETNKCCHRTMKPVYKGVKSACMTTYKQYTGVECPQNDYSEIYCCGGGYRCCNKDYIIKLKNYAGPGQNSMNESGAYSMGAIAGFVFLAVIVAGTLLTLATRYIKIKFRRDQERAPMHSREYIDAINRRTNGDEGDDNNNGERTPVHVAQHHRHHAPPIYYIQPIVEEPESPPTYDEAISSCPVILEESSGNIETQSPEMTQNQFRFRPPTRPSRGNTHTNAQLPTIKDNIPMSSLDQQYDSVEQEESITLPKFEDSYA